MNQKEKIAFVKAELENIVFLKIREKILNNVATAINQVESYLPERILNSKKLRMFAKEEFLKKLIKRL